MSGSGYIFLVPLNFKIECMLNTLMMHLKYYPTQRTEVLALIMEVPKNSVALVLANGAVTSVKSISVISVIFLIAQMVGLVILKILLAYIQ